MEFRKAQGRVYIAILAAALAGPALGSIAVAAPPYTERIFVWSAGHAIRMPVRLYIPAGRGPFKLAIINHGTSSNAAVRAAQNLDAYAAIGYWFVKRGFIAAVPQRPGHGETGGEWVEDYGPCDHPHYFEAGLAAAREIRAVLDALRQRPDVRRDGVVLVGHSAGGWASLALASLQPTGIVGVINFAGGLGGRSYDIAYRNCAPERLVAAAARYGATTRVPTLWIYATNDTYFTPALVAAMVNAFVSAGGRASLHLLNGGASDGHFLLFGNAPDPKWGQLVNSFLSRLQTPKQK